MANMTIDQSKLNIISDNLTKKLSGKSITEIDEDFLNYIKYEISESSLFIDELVDALNFHIEENDTSMSLSGTTNIFNYPEFSDVLRAKTFLNMLEEKEISGVTVKIYDKERMLIELLRNKNSMPYDLYKEIIGNYRKIIEGLEIWRIQEYADIFPKSKMIKKALEEEVF